MRRIYSRSKPDFCNIIEEHYQLPLCKALSQIRCSKTNFFQVNLCNFRTYLKTIWQIWSSKVKSREELFIFAIIFCIFWKSLRRIAIYEQNMGSFRSTDLLHASAQKLLFLNEFRVNFCRYLGISRVARFLKN